MTNCVSVSGMLGLTLVPRLVFLFLSALISAHCLSNPPEHDNNTMSSGPNPQISLADMAVLLSPGNGSEVSGRILTEENADPMESSSDEVSKRFERSLLNPPYRGPRSGHPPEIQIPMHHGYIDMPRMGPEAGFAQPMPRRRRTGGQGTLAVGAYPFFLPRYPNVVDKRSSAAVETEDHMSAKEDAFAIPFEDVSSFRQNTCSGPGCTCKGRVSFVGKGYTREASRICDGFCDCPTCDDETGCCVTIAGSFVSVSRECPIGGPNTFQCPSDQTYCTVNGRALDTGCFSQEQRCDGELQCLNSWKDESEHCFGLSEALPQKPGTFPLSPKGKLLRNIRGSWHLLCADAATSKIMAVQACRSSSGQLQNGFPTVTSSIPENLPEGTTFARMQNGKWVVEKTCTGSLHDVKCSRPKCGQRGGFALKMDDATFDAEEIGNVVHFGPSPRSAREASLSAGGQQGADDDRIVGGVASIEKTHPWVVALKVTTPDGVIYDAAGSIITEDWILTAAHVLEGAKGINGKIHPRQDCHVQASAGLVRLTSASPSTQIRSGILAIVHEDYSPSTFVNDIALGKVNRPFVFNQYVNALCLPNSRAQNAPDGLPCVGAGWGHLKEGGVIPDHLQEVSLPIWGTCDVKPFVVKSKDKMFCAGPKEGGKDTCQGDSGGALVCSYQGLAPLVEGIVSYGDGCARPNSPGVYTRVSNYVRGIRDILVKEMFGALDDPFYQLGACPGMFCDDGRCLVKAQRCNKIHDCPGSGEDELGCGRQRRLSSFPWA